MTESKHGKRGDARPKLAHPELAHSEVAHSETLSSRSRDALASYRASPTWGDRRKSSVLRRVETSVRADVPAPDLDPPAWNEESHRVVSRRPRLDIPRTALRMVVALAAAAAVLLLIRAMNLRSLVGGASQRYGSKPSMARPNQRQPTTPSTGGAASTRGRPYP